MQFDISLYNDEFYKWHLVHVRDSSIRCMDWFIEHYRPSSVIDFGCGIGSYLESAYKAGLMLKGYEISEAALNYTPENIQPFIEYADCTKPLYPGVWDCVISFEVVEHIEPSGTDQFVRNIIDSVGRWLLFTAAPPEQEGTGHINCHDKDFWMDKFSELKYNQAKTDEVRLAWAILGAPDYICNNLMIFER
jgi:SAM-dependent methyltransferase